MVLVSVEAAGRHVELGILQHVLVERTLCRNAVEHVGRGHGVAGNLHENGHFGNGVEADALHGSGNVDGLHAAPAVKGVVGHANDGVAVASLVLHGFADIGGGVFGHHVAVAADDGSGVLVLVEFVFNIVDRDVEFLVHTLDVIETAPRRGGLVGVERVKRHDEHHVVEAPLRESAFGRYGAGHACEGCGRCCGEAADTFEIFLNEEGVGTDGRHFGGDGDGLHERGARESEVLDSGDGIGRDFALPVVDNACNGDVCAAGAVLGEGYGLRFASGGVEHVLHVSLIDIFRHRLGDGLDVAEEAPRQCLAVGVESGVRHAEFAVDGILLHKGEVTVLVGVERCGWHGGVYGERVLGFGVDHAESVAADALDAGGQADGGDVELHFEECAVAYGGNGIVVLFISDGCRHYEVAFVAHASAVGDDHGCAFRVERIPKTVNLRQLGADGQDEAELFPHIGGLVGSHATGRHEEGYGLADGVVDALHVGRRGGRHGGEAGEGGKADVFIECHSP